MAVQATKRLSIKQPIEIIEQLLMYAHHFCFEVLFPQVAAYAREQAEK
jgi:hypothetical protein